jgi:hypothetical protein
MSPSKRKKAASTPPPATNKRNRTSASTTAIIVSKMLDQQLESLQAELDPERSARKFSQRQQERLEQQLALAAEEEARSCSTKNQLE